MNSFSFQRLKTKDIIPETNNLLIKDYITQIDSLKSYISELEMQIQKLKSQIRELGDRNIYLIEYEHKNNTLNIEQKQLKQTISDLEKDILELIKKGKEEKRDIASQFETEINYYKRITDAVKNKIDAAEHIIHLNSLQHNYILKLEKEIEDIKKNNSNKIKEINVTHDLHYKHLKKKMFDLIKKSSQDIQKENKTNIEIHSKFSSMNKIEFLDELEKLNAQIMELIKENEIKQKKIMDLTQENNTYYSIDKILKNKNIKFSNIIKGFLKKEKNKEEKVNNNICKTEDGNDLFKTKIANRINPPSTKLEKEYNDLFIKYNSLKDKFDYIIDKERIFQKKYYGIINLYDTALKDLIQNEKEIPKNINITLDHFIEDDLDTYSKEEKIKIICLLIKHLLPLIKSQSTKIIKLRNLFNDIDIKFKINSNPNFYSRNQSSNIVKSLYDFRQYSSDLDYSIRKEEKLKLKNKSIFNAYNNTFNNINNNNNIINLINTKEDSKSVKSSFFGINTDMSSIKKKHKISDIGNETNNNNFIFTAFNFYDNKKKRKNSEIKLFKKGLLINDWMKKHSSLQRMMVFKDINDKNKIIQQKNT